MSLFHRPTARRIFSTAITAACALFFVAAGVQAFAQQTHLWTQSRFDEFSKGTPLGVAVGSDGTLRQGPGLRETLTTPSTFVWSIAFDKSSGATFLGTGSPATILRVDKNGKSFTLFESKDVSVQALALGPDGSLFAATLPGGKVYKLNASAATKLDESSATMVFDAATIPEASKVDGTTVESKPADGKSHYIWALTFDQKNRLYIATGGPAAVYRLDGTTPGAKPEEFFRSDEQHIRSLAWDAKGNLIAGSDGSGLVYRISPEGKGYVLFEAPRREIPSVAVAADGTIYAASVGDKSHNPLPPLPLQGMASITITVMQPGTMQATNASASVPEGTDIYVLKDNEAPQKLWSDKDDIVYALSAQPQGVVALTGNRGRIFSIQSDGRYADIGHLGAQQGLCLTAGPDQDLLIGTGNTGKLAALGTTSKHEYASDVLDAGAMARFGRVEIEPGATGYEIWTRTGNVDQPVRGWSDWALLKDDTVASPSARFLQWKAVLQSGGKLGGVGINYLPVNSAPVVDDIVVAPGARLNAQSQSAGQQTVTINFPSSGQGASISYDGTTSAPLQAQKDRTAITVRWAAHDDDGDDLEYSIYLRGDGESVWRLLKKNLTDKAYSFDAIQIPDGGYQVKVVASDAPSHSFGDALTGEKISERFELDTTPPVITGLAASEKTSACEKAPCPPAVHIVFEASDATSPIAHAEYSIDAGRWQFLAPVGTLSDAKHESYAADLPASSLAAQPGEHLLTVRVYDRYDNVGVAKTVFSSAAK